MHELGTPNGIRTRAATLKGSFWLSDRCRFISFWLLRLRTVSI